MLSSVKSASEKRQDCCWTKPLPASHAAIAGLGPNKPLCAAAPTSWLPRRVHFHLVTSEARTTQPKLREQLRHSALSQSRIIVTTGRWADFMAGINRRTAALALHSNSCSQKEVAGECLGRTNDPFTAGVKSTMSSSNRI